MRTMILSDLVCYFKVIFIQGGYISRHTIECKPSDLRYKITELVQAVDHHRSGTGYRRVCNVEQIQMKETVYNEEYLVIATTEVNISGTMIGIQALTWHYRVTMENVGFE